MENKLMQHCFASISVCLFVCLFACLVLLFLNYLPSFLFRSLLVIYLFQLMVTNDIQTQYGEVSQQIHSTVLPSAALVTANFNPSDNTQCPELSVEAFNNVFTNIDLDLHSGK
jgi:hypothetical protein